MNKKHLVNLLQEWIDTDKVNELDDKTHTRYQNFARKSAKHHDNEGELKIQRSGNDETAGKDDFAKRDKRERGIDKSKQLQKKKTLLKPVQIVAQPSLAQRIKKSMGFSD